jgi:ubiquinone/menaquinone biosynthesis C-methylase UbiE
MGPDRERAQRLYAELASHYDRSAIIRAIAPIRRRALARLAAAPGETVLDVACGTGINFPAIEQAIGPSGRLIGIELSRDMLAVARQRVAAGGWRNITLMQSAIEDADLPSHVDAALFSFTHDVLRSPTAVGRVADALAPDGRAVACGLMDPWWWALPMRSLRRVVARRFVTTHEGMAEPWSHLGDLLRVQRVERPPIYLGAMYVVTARWSPTTSVKTSGNVL